LKSIAQILFITFLITLTTFSSAQSPANLGVVCAESQHRYGVQGYEDSQFSWFLDDGGGIIVSGHGEDTIYVNWGYELGTYSLTVYETTVAGCTGPPSEAIVQVSAPLVDIGPDFIELCQPDSMVFDARGDYTQPYIMAWQDGTISPTYTAKTTELVWVRVTDGNNCSRVDSIDFSAHPLPVFDLGNDTLLCDEQNPLVLDGGDYAFYDWRTTSGLYSTDNPYYAYPVKPFMDTIILNVTDINGCEKSDSVTIFPCDIASMFKDMPNTITPNDDGHNDVWVIPFMEKFPDAVVEIFDRWGRLVHRTEDFSTDKGAWDGVSNGRPMPMDSYFYVLDLKYMNVDPISGAINLIR
jgi:gliding motility-associated-like protein